jgi:hypothetical protein
MRDEKLLFAARGGIIGPDLYRGLDMPRCRVWSSIGEGGHGPGAAFAPLSGGGWTNAEYDTDSMTTLASPYLTCKTPGLYLVLANFNFGPSPNSADQIWMRLMDPALSRTYASVTTQGVNPTTFGVHLEILTLWPANAGSQIGVYLYTSAATDVGGGIDICWMSACMISTLG